MNIQNVIFSLMGGLGVFLYGMRSMSDGLQTLAGDSLRRIIGALTNNRIVAVFVGLVVTTIVQSSSVTTVMVVGFVNSYLMTLTQAIGVVLGANIGTTITGWIIAIKITKYALPILGVGVGFYLFSKVRSLKELGHILFGVGMVFLGLSIMKSGLSGIKGDPGFVALFSHFDATTLGSTLLAIIAGCLLTVLVQSSSATLGITIALAASGVLTFQAAAALILGENIGTTITAQIASIGTNVNARRAARAHFLFNALGTLVIFIIFQQYVDFIEWLVPHDANLLDSQGFRPYVTTHIAATHTLFNVINVLLFLPFVKVLARFVTWWIPDPEGGTKPVADHPLSHLDPKMMGSPALAIEQARLELVRMGELVQQMLENTRTLFDTKKPTKDEMKKFEKLRSKILRQESLTDDSQKELTVFLVKVLESELTEPQTNEIRSMIRVADELESIGDYCESLSVYQKRCLHEGIWFSAEALSEIQQLSKKVFSFFEDSLKAYNSHDSIYVNKAKAAGGTINELADEIREAHLSRMNKKICNAFAGLVFSDIIVALRRIKNHTFNLAEAAAGLK